MLTYVTKKTVSEIEPSKMFLYKCNIQYTERGYKKELNYVFSSKSWAKNGL